MVIFQNCSSFVLKGESERRKYGRRDTTIDQVYSSWREGHANDNGEGGGIVKSVSTIMGEGLRGVGHADDNMRGWGDEGRGARHR